MTRHYNISGKYRYIYYLLGMILAGCVLWGCAARPTPFEAAPLPVEDRIYADAERLFSAGDYENALLQYRKYVDRHPDRSLADDALMKIASIYLAGGRYEDAREQYRRVLDEYPDTLSAANAGVEMLATFYHEGDYSEFFKRIAVLNADALPPSARPRFFKLTGDVHLSSGNVKAAVDAYAMSLSCDPEKKGVEAIPEMVLAVGELDPRDIRELLDGPDYLPKAYLMYSLGQNNLRAGRDQAAGDAFAAFIEAYPDNELAEDARLHMADIEQKRLYSRFSVGCLLPLTGPYSSWGKRVQHGVELAYSRFLLDHPEIPLTILYKDIGADVSRVVQAVQELGEAQVAAILGPIVMARPAAEEAQRLGIPIITLSQSDDITDVGAYVFRNFLTHRTQVNTVVSYLVEDLGLKRFAILYPDEKYGDTFMNLFWDDVIDKGGVVVGCEPYNSEETHFADPIRKLVGLYYEMPEDLKVELAREPQPLPEEVWRFLNPLAFLEDDPDMLPWAAVPSFEDMGPISVEVDLFALLDTAEEPLTGEGDYEEEEEAEPEAVVDFDAVFIPDSPKKVGLIVPQLAYYDVENVYFVGTNLWHSDELIQMARRYLQTAILTDGFFVDSDLPMVRQFVESFQDVYGKQPGFIEAVSYDTAGILFDLVSRPDVSFRSTIREKLFSEPFFQGVTGLTSFLESGEVDKQLYLLQIKGGKFRMASTIQRDPLYP